MEFTLLKSEIYFGLTLLLKRKLEKSIFCSLQEKTFTGT